MIQESAFMQISGDNGLTFSEKNFIQFKKYIRNIWIYGINVL